MPLPVEFGERGVVGPGGLLGVVPGDVPLGAFIPPLCVSVFAPLAPVPGVLPPGGLVLERSMPLLLRMPELRSIEPALATPSEFRVC